MGGLLPVLCMHTLLELVWVRHSGDPLFRGIEITSRGPRKMSFNVRQRSIARHGIPNDIKEMRWHFRANGNVTTMNSF